MEPLKVAFKECPRCGQPHVVVLCLPFKKPAGIYTHWGMCPVTQEPVIVKVSDKL